MTHLASWLFCVAATFAGGYFLGRHHGRFLPRTVGEAIDRAKANGHIPEPIFCAEDNCANRVEIHGSRCKYCLWSLR